MKVTRIALSDRLNPGKYAALSEQARRLGRVRSQVWQRYASIAGAGLKDRQVRDRWLADGTHHQFSVLANAWKETVRDAMADIAANREAAKVEVKRAIRRHTTDPAGQKRLHTALKTDRWAQDAYLSRQMRKHWRRGHNHTHNQIIVRADQHHTRADENGRLWLAVPGLVPRQLVKIPLSTTVAPTGTLRLILRHHRVEIHHQVDAATMKTSQHPAGTRTVGVDLTKTFTGRRSLGKNTNRRLTAWTKGVTAEALTSVSQRRGSTLVHVNAAYTSQTCHHCAALGRRSGDRFHCTSCGVVWQADVNAAINILQRHGDSDITLHTPHRVVKQIVRERADRHRTRLPVPDSNPPLPVESEPSLNAHPGLREARTGMRNEKEAGPQW